MNRAGMTSGLLFGVLALLFVGFFKGAIAWPVDLTLVLLGVLYALLLFHADQVRDVAHSRPILILGVFLAYVAIRVAPGFSDVGVAKVARVMLIGVPVLLAGYVVGRENPTAEKLSKILLISGVLVSVWVTMCGLLEEGGERQVFFSGGYQLTGILIGLALVAASYERAPIAFGIAFLGLAVCGNSSSALFGGLISLFIWARRRDFGLAARSIGCGLILVALYLSIAQLPVLFIVILTKVEGLLANIAGLSIAGYAPDPLAKTAAASADRLWLFADALRHWWDSPWYGKGVGGVSYLLPEYVYPHNIFLELLAETGLIGFGLFLAFLLSLIAPLGGAPNAGRIFAFSAFLFLLSMVGGDISSRFLWFCLGLLLAVRVQPVLKTQVSTL